MIATLQQIFTAPRGRTVQWPLGLCVVLIVATFMYVSVRKYQSEEGAVRGALASRANMTETLSLLKDAETGARREATHARRRSEELTQDISGREEAERALREQTQLLHSVLESMGDGVIVLDRHRTLAIINATATRFLPWTIGASTPDASLDRSSPSVPDGRTSLVSERAPLARALRGESLDGFSL